MMNDSVGNTVIAMRRDGWKNSDWFVGWTRELSRLEDTDIALVLKVSTLRATKSVIDRARSRLKRSERYVLEAKEINAA